MRDVSDENYFRIYLALSARYFQHTIKKSRNLFRLVVVVMGVVNLLSPFNEDVEWVYGIIVKLNC